jgi:hypothetical protein
VPIRDSWFGGGLFEGPLCGHRTGRHRKVTKVEFPRAEGKNRLLSLTDQAILSLPVHPV